MDIRNNLGYITEREREILDLDPHGSEAEGYPLAFLAERIGTMAELHSAKQAELQRYMTEVRDAGGRMTADIEKQLAGSERTTHYLVDMMITMATEELVAEIQDEL